MVVCSICGAIQKMPFKNDKEKRCSICGHELKPRKKKENKNG